MAAQDAARGVNSPKPMAHGEVERLKGQTTPEILPPKTTADFDVEDLTNKLGMMLKDEEGKNIETLGNWVSRIKEPEYLYGWE